MNNEKILNLMDVDNDDFEAIKEAIEDWKASGYPGKFVFVTEKEAQETLLKLKGIIQDTYNKGVWRGGFALAGGIAIGSMIYHTVEHFKTKKKDEE